MQITEYNETEAGLAKLRERMKGVVYDVTTIPGMGLAKKDRRELVSLRTALENKRKEIKAPALERCKLIDEEAKRVCSEILALETPIDQQIKAEEARREEERQEKLRQAAAAQKILDDKIIEIGKLPLMCIGKDSEYIGKFLAAVKFKLIGGEFTGENLERAENAKAVAIAEIITILGDTLQAEEKAAQLKAEQEAEFARLAEERAERERQDAIRKQEIAKQEAELAEFKRQNEIEAARLRKLAEDEQCRLAAQRALFEAEQAKIREEQEAAQRLIREKEEAAAAEVRRQQAEEDAKRREEERQVAIAAEIQRAETEKARRAEARARKVAESKCKDAVTAFKKILSICQDTNVPHLQAREEIALIAEGNLS
ncbi:MAG: hypothetical protein A2Y38_16265 [Spirochaetes bacterium GWB1_59_5]|nr:MAG: hypothetical protein A2Y38_16265 [Spirochaetes bacterium GWB1_59_5]